MYVRTDPLLVELGVPTHSNPNACSKLTRGKRDVVTDRAFLDLEQRRTNLPLEKETELTVLESCRINLKVSTPRGEVGWILRRHVAADPIAPEPQDPAW